MPSKSNNGRLSGSFRDPSGFLFISKGTLYRQVNFVYKEYYDLLMSSELYKNLTETDLLISHHEVDTNIIKSDNAYKLISPEVIPFISYPYEWSFSQLKDAALLTLDIQKKSLALGMSLKDCSAYNIQFKGGRPIFIDTLSFEKYNEGLPWVAYRQFCQHFLAPLALMSYQDISLNQLLRTNIDGIPLDLTSRLLPSSTKIRFSLLTHIHIHAKSQKHYADKKIKADHKNISKFSMLGLIDNLESAIRKLDWSPTGTEWADYYQGTNYSTAMLDQKKELVDDYIQKTQPEIVWDLGANTGMFSDLSANRGIETISFDIDPSCVEMNYRECKKLKKKSILPLLLDLANPSPAIGWENKERNSLIQRGPADTVLALALIHHLAISNNVPLGKTAEFFAGIGKNLIIEFVPKSDSMVHRLLTTRKDIFPNYTQVDFEENYRQYFKIISSQKIKDSQRTIYLMKKK
ncbi:MAG: SAM-dependent methyltransferase [candidate division Zixibacteria bacterium]|nr:SAM-dependent methyltransferase [candidate division Zixibacteria bacterium]